MQMNGIGNSHSNMHHVTNCIHDHKHGMEGKVGGAAANTSTASQQVTVTSEQPGQAFSLSGWLQNTLSGARSLLGNIWGSKDASVQGEVIAQAGIETVTDIAAQNASEVVTGSVSVQSGLQQNLQQDQTHTNALHVSQIEAASATVQPTQNFNNNPYFAAIQEDTAPRQTIWQKLKVRFQNISGFLAKRFSFSNSSSFQTKQERPKEDLSRHSRYREDEVEIDCILTDDSYLMDSYNKKGEYSKLSADK